MICVLLALPCAGTAQSDEEKSTREFIKRLAKERDPKERADAAHWLGGRENPEAVAALARALSDSDASVRQAAASALWTRAARRCGKPELQKTLGDRKPPSACGGAPTARCARRRLARLETCPTARKTTRRILSARGLIGIDPPEKLAPILTWLAKKSVAAAHPARGQSSFDERKSAEAEASAISSDNPVASAAARQHGAPSPNRRYARCAGRSKSCRRAPSTSGLAHIPSRRRTPYLARR